MTFLERTSWERFRTMHESLSNQHSLSTPVLRCRQSMMPRIAPFLRLVLVRTSSTDYSGIHAPVYWNGVVENLASKGFEGGRYGF